MDEDSFQMNIEGVSDLIGSDINKVNNNNPTEQVGELSDVLTLDKSDAELLELRDEYESRHSKYYPKIEPRTKQNKIYYSGSEYQSGLNTKKGVASNLIFEGEETFLPEALAKNPWNFKYR